MNPLQFLIDEKDQWIGGTLELAPDPPFTYDIETTNIKDIIPYDQPNECIFYIEGCSFDCVITSLAGNAFKISEDKTSIQFLKNYLPDFKITKRKNV